MMVQWRSGDLMKALHKIVGRRPAGFPILREASDLLWRYRWAPIILLAVLAIPLGLIGRHEGFSRSGILTVYVMLAVIAGGVLRAFLNTVVFWWIVWGLAALIWIVDMTFYISSQY